MTNNMTNNLHSMTLTELSTGLHQKDFTSVELTQHFLQRIRAMDTQLNAFITVTENQALQQAEQADRLLQSGKATPVTGLPIAHKDIFCTEGVKTTCGSKMLHNFIAPYESTVTQLCQQQGLVSLGKTNMDEFAMGSSNETSYFGTCKNPWDLERTPGGSSGGSAAAVAARLVPVATGTDTGGSIRQPAAFCGVTGLKPTYGRVSRWGMIAFASSLDQAGLLTQTAEDAALLLQVIAGFDEKDSTSVNEPVPDYLQALNQPVQDLTLGLPIQFFNDELDPAQARQLDEAINALKALGVKTKPVDLPHLPLSVPCYYVIAPAECSSNLSRYDGVRFGYRCDTPASLEDLYKRSRSEGFGAEVKRRIMVGAYTLSTGYFDAYYLQAQKIRRLIQEDFKKALKTVNMILAPTTPGTAFKLGEKQNDPVSMYLSDIYTIAVNLAGLPAVSLPIGLVSNLPAGMQLIGNFFAEPELLNLAHQFQQTTGWHQQKPKE